MDKISIKAYSKNIDTTIVLNGSKSIANRVLIIQALCKENFKIFNLPNAEDTVQLLSALQNPDEKINAGASLVQVWTGFIYEGPGIVKRICKSINIQS